MDIVDHNNIQVTMTTRFTTAAAFGMYPTSVYIVVGISGKKKNLFVEIMEKFKFQYRQILRKELKFYGTNPSISTTLELTTMRWLSLL